MWRRICPVLLVLVLTSVLVVIPSMPVSAADTTYYVDSVGGNDGNNGASESTPWKTLSRASSATFGAGDKICFKRNRQFTGTLTLHGSGTSTDPITIDAYGTGSKPVIIGDATAGPTGAIKLENLSHYAIQNLEIQAPCTSGLILLGCSHVTVRDCHFTNIEYLPPGMPEGTDAWAVSVGGGATDGSYNTIADCTFKRCSKGVIILTGDNIILRDSYFYDINDIAALFAGHCVGRTVTNSRITGCVFDYTNNTSLGWSPVMFGGTDNCYQEYCEIKNTPAGQWDHQVYDFDANCRNSYIQYNYSHDNRGDLMHSYWMGDESGNGPCYFRYNISVNDKTLYNGVKTTYGLQMYNNVFFNFGGNFGRDIVASDLSDTVVRNNIFHMKPGAGVSSLPPGSDYNCYYNCTRPSTETHSIEADPQFIDAGNPPGGLRIASTSPCRDAGTSVSGNDGRDYWGNALYNGLPDIGAHEYVAPPIAPTGNLALHCTVTSSSSLEDRDWGRARLVDGTINTEPYTCGWRSLGNDGVDHIEWITIDLGAIHSVNRAILYPRNDYGYAGVGFPRSFQIKTSPDNTNWTMVATRTNYPQPGNAPQYFSFSNRTARYVKISMTGLRQAADGKYGAAFAEIEVLNDRSPVPRVYPPSGNLALNKDVTALDSAENWGWYKVKLTDGMRDSVAESMGWSTDPSLTNNRAEWVEVDLGAVCSVGRVDLYPRNDSGNVGGWFPVDFTIQVSTDNLHWTTVARETGYQQPADGLVRSFPFEAAGARYVKVNATSLRNDASGNHGTALAEIEVFN